MKGGEQEGSRTRRKPNKKGGEQEESRTRKEANKKGECRSANPVQGASGERRAVAAVAAHRPPTAPLPRGQWRCLLTGSAA